MCAPRSDQHGVLSTATIFEDAVYLSEALKLPVNQNEEDVDAELTLLARESGIQDPYRYLPQRNISRALSTVTLDDSDHRSSMSIHSQETQSTSIASAPSRTSRDHVYSPERSMAPRFPPKFGRAPPSDSSAQAMDGSIDSSKPRQPSTVSMSPSVLSSSSSLSSQPSRKKRASGLFGMFRKESNSCNSSSHNTHHGKGRGPKLECGHSLSHYAIRIHIQDALDKGGRTVPACCGIPLPREVLEQVLAKEEADLVTHTVPQPSDATSSRDSGYCEKGISSEELAFPSENATPPATSTSASTATSRRRHEAISIESALAQEAFKSFRVQEKEQFERVIIFEANQRKALSTFHQVSLTRLASQHAVSKTEKITQHAHDLEQLEETQIVAEHDMRKAHDQETLNAATALKHMDAYCLGNRQTHPDHPHVVTEEDFKKLDRQRLLQQNLPRKHENAINVLRARQEREIKKRLLKQTQELQLMDEDYERKKLSEELEFQKAMEKLDIIISERRKRLLQRWDLKFEMWRRDWEQQHGTAVNGLLEHEKWPSHILDNLPPISDTSSLAPFVQATD